MDCTVWLLQLRRHLRAAASSATAAARIRSTRSLSTAVSSRARAARRAISATDAAQMQMLQQHLQHNNTTTAAAANKSAEKNIRIDDDDDDSNDRRSPRRAVRAEVEPSEEEKVLIESRFELGVIPLPQQLNDRSRALLKQVAPGQSSANASAMSQFLFARTAPGLPENSVPRPGSVKFKNTLNYAKAESLAFMHARMASCYATTVRVLDEICKRDPAFSPKTMLDFGSGLSTALWAADAVWQSELQSYTGVDLSTEMLHLAQDLRSGEQAPFTKFRRFLPTNETFNLVVCAHTLLELADPASRAATLKTLWAKTEDYLVLIELGNPAGFAAILEARDTLLPLLGDKGSEVNSSSESGSESAGHIFGPCPHAGTCPLAETKRPCHFPVRAGLPSHLALSDFVKAHGHRAEKFTYLILSKRNPAPQASWSRAIATPSCRRGHVVFEACGSDGKLWEHTVTKGKHTPATWHDSRKFRSWGDLLTSQHLTSRTKTVPLDLGASLMREEIVQPLDEDEADGHVDQQQSVTKRK
eukprot:m.125441 g.125441  ORF g.125441 m.125441 type:complete len:529 (-) comp16319_c1_seq12:1204-2790(-)